MVVLLSGVAHAELSKRDLRSLWPLWSSTRSMDQVLLAYGDLAESRLKPHFQKAGVPYPPEKITLLSLKEERLMELWAWYQGRWRLIHDYKIMGASGHMGPKLRQGDKQVPEGFYKVTLLNPKSRYHLSIKINYPNAFDKKHARREGRSKPGNNIFIHGTSYSIGCLAMGDPASEELFVLINKIGRKNVEVIIAPYDFRSYKPVKRAGDPNWVDGLYKELHKRMLSYNRPVKKSRATTRKKGGVHPDERIK
jgi:hypothetical protein